MAFLVVHKDTQKIMEVLDDISPIDKDSNALQVAAVISTALNKGNVVIVSSQVDVDIIRGFFRPEFQDDFVIKKQEGIFSLCRTNKWLAMHRARLDQKNPISPSSPPLP